MLFRRNLLTHHGNFSEADATAFFNTTRNEQITGIAVGTSGTAVVARLLGSGVDDRLKQAKMIQCCKILFHKLSKSLTPTFEKQIIPEMNKMNDDGTRLLYHILKVMMSTTATASKVALEQLIDLSFKAHGWDLDKMHTLFDQLIATLKAAKEEQSTGTQLLYLMKAYKTNPENEEWMAHVRNMDSMIKNRLKQEFGRFQHCGFPQLYLPT